MCACLALTSAQFRTFDYDFGFGSSYNAPAYNSFAAAARDPRANTGKGLQGFYCFYVFVASQDDN